MTLNRLIPRLTFITGIALSVAVAKAESHSISIKKDQFDPQEITIKAGDTLAWQNDDDSDHTVSAADHSFTSATLKHGEHFEHTFTTAGTFTIADKLHPRLKETVTVK